MEEHDARLLVRHVRVDGDDVDVGRPERPQHRLQLALQHREVAIYHGGLVSSRKCRPRVDPHLRPEFEPVRLRPLREHELCHSVLRLGRAAEDGFERLRVDGVLGGNRWPPEVVSPCPDLSCGLYGLPDLSPSSRVLIAVPPSAAMPLEYAPTR